jgi:hypothetical protein
MAILLTAVNAYRPKISLLPTVELKELVEFISSRTGLNKGELQMALAELSNAVQFYNKRGHGVKLPGLGTYLPSIDTQGKFSISHRLDREIGNALNSPGAFTGNIENRHNIGKTSDELIALWNADHPDDPVVL